jgi:outer membrane protein TolC
LPAPAGPVAFSERLADYALRYEPRLKVLRQQVQQAETSVARTRRQRYPDLLLGTEARNYSGNGGFRQAMVTVSFNVPWGNAGKYRGEVRREQALLQAAELETRDYEQSVREEVYRVTVALEAARREAVLYRDEIVPRSGQALAAAHAAWMANRGLFNDVLEARRLLIDARLMYTRAVAEQWELLSDLVLCCGLGDLEALQMIGAQPPAKE